MSRVGQAPVPVPSGVEVKIEGRVVTVKGPKGELSRTLPEALSVTQEGGQLTVARADDERESRALSTRPIHVLPTSYPRNCRRRLTKPASSAGSQWCTRSRPPSRPMPSSI